MLQILFLYIHICEKGWEALIYIHFFNTLQIVYTASSPFVDHYDGGIVMEIPQSSSVLWGSKNSTAFLTSCTASDFSKSLKGQYYLVSDSFICNSVLIIMLATSNPTGLAAFTLFSMRWLTSQMPSWLPSSGHRICRFPQGRAAHRMWALPVCNFCCFGTLISQRLLVALAALWCRTRTRVRQIRHLGRKIQGSTHRVLWVLY